MTAARQKVLVVGAAGSIGRLVIEEATKAGYDVRALVRDPRRARDLAEQAEIVARSGAWAP